MHHLFPQCLETKSSVLSYKNTQYYTNTCSSNSPKRFSFFIPPRSCSLLAFLHLSNAQECKAMLTHHSVGLPPISRVCLTISIPGAASQLCKAELVFQVCLEILVTYIQHQFSFSWLQGIFFLKINFKTYGVACVIKHFKEITLF